MCKIKMAMADQATHHLGVSLTESTCHSEELCRLQSFLGVKYHSNSLDWKVLTLTTMTKIGAIAKVPHLEDWNGDLGLELGIPSALGSVSDRVRLRIRVEKLCPQKSNLVFQNQHRHHPRDKWKNLQYEMRYYMCKKNDGNQRLAVCKLWQWSATVNRSKNVSLLQTVAQKYVTKLVNIERQSF